MDGKSSHGGYCGPAVKPIALNMVQQVMRGLRRSALPMSGIGGIRNVAGRGGVHPAGLRHGAGVHGGDALRLSHRRGHDRRALSNWMDEKGFATIEDFRGLSLPKVTDWKHLNLNYKIVAQIDEALCIGCELCHIACWDGAHQCIHLDRVTGPVDGHVEVHVAEPRLRRSREQHRGDADSEARSAEEGTDHMRRRWREFRAWTRPSAWAAISARWSARSKGASRWRSATRAATAELG